MTDAIIEAAARAISAAYLKEITWEDQEETGHTFYRNLAKVVLAAVTPLIEARTLERAAKEAEVFHRHENWEVMSVVRKVAAAIRALADQP